MTHSTTYPLLDARPLEADTARPPGQASPDPRRRATALGRFLHPTSLAEAVRSLPGAAAAATVFGLCAGLGTTRPVGLLDALALPAVPLVFLAGFVPSTWVLLTLLEGRTSLAQVLRAGFEAAAVYGIALLGLAPAVAFLELTSDVRAGGPTLAALTTLAAFAAWCLGLHRYAGALRRGDAPVETSAQHGVVLFVVGLGLLVFRHTALPAILRLHEVAS